MFRKDWREAAVPVCEEVARRSVRIGLFVGYGRAAALRCDESVYRLENDAGGYWFRQEPFGAGVARVLSCLGRRVRREENERYWPIGVDKAI